MSTTKAACLVIGILMMASAAWAGEGSYPFLAASYTGIPEADFQAPEADSAVESREYRLALGLAVVDTEELTVDIGADYQYTRFEYSGIDGRNRDLHQIGRAHV